MGRAATTTFLPWTRMAANNTIVFTWFFHARWNMLAVPDAGCDRKEMLVDGRK